MKKSLLFMVFALGLAAASLALAATGIGREGSPSTFVLIRADAQPPEHDVVRVPEEVLDRLPPKAKEGWLEASRVGMAAFTLPEREAEEYRERMRELARAQGKLPAHYFEFQGQYFRNKNLIP